MIMVSYSSRILKVLLLGVAVGLAGCASNEALVAGTDRPVTESAEMERPAWASASEENTKDSVVQSDVKPPFPDEQSVDAVEAAPSVEEVHAEESTPKKKGFWSFLSRKRDAGEETREESGEENSEADDNDKENLGEDTAPGERLSDLKEEAEEEKGIAKLPRIDEEKGVYKLKAGDVLMITLSGSGGLNDQIETVVDEEGGVKLRFIGAVKADGLTTTELEREIEAEYTDRQKIYKDVVARVVVPNRFYFIGREVRSPGRYPIVGKVSLSQAISAAGNFTEWANERKIILVRGNERYVIDFREISKDPSKDILLQPGDSVTVERRILF